MFVTRDYYSYELYIIYDKKNLDNEIKNMYLFYFFIKVIKNEEHSYKDRLPMLTVFFMNAPDKKNPLSY